MKVLEYLLQFLVILAVSLFGELLNRVVPLPIPASIYGMLILFVALCTGGIKLSYVKGAGKLLIFIMPLLFLPAAVGLVDSWAVMQGFIVAIIVTVAVSTVLVAAAAGRVTQYFINRKEREGK